MTIRYLQCACCGQDAGRWQQWWNRDTGFGLCGKCAAWITAEPTARRYMTSEEMDRCYGIEGVHRAPAAIMSPSFVNTASKVES